MFNWSIGEPINLLCAICLDQQRPYLFLSEKRSVWAIPFSPNHFLLFDLKTPKQFFLESDPSDIVGHIIRQICIWCCGCDCWNVARAKIIFKWPDHDEWENWHNESIYFYYSNEQRRGVNEDFKLTTDSKNHTRWWQLHFFDQLTKNQVHVRAFSYSNFSRIESPKSFVWSWFNMNGWVDQQKSEEDSQTVKMKSLHSRSFRYPDFEDVRNVPICDSISKEDHRVDGKGRVHNH